MKARCLGVKRQQYNQLNKQTGLYDEKDETILFVCYPFPGVNGNACRQIRINYGEFDITEANYNSLVDELLDIDYAPYGNGSIITSINIVE